MQLVERSFWSRSRALCAQGKSRNAKQLVPLAFSYVNYYGSKFLSSSPYPRRGRDSVAWIGFTTTYKDAGTAKIPVSRTRHHLLWVGLWVGKSIRQAAALLRQRPNFSATLHNPQACLKMVVGL
jgi:hypothetical protein